MRKTYLSFLIASLLLLGQGCKKAAEADLSHQQSLIESAKNYFNQHVISAAITPASSDTGNGKNNRNPRKTLQKTADWDHAAITRLSTGEAVVVPLHYKKPFVIKSNLGGKDKLYSINDLAKLLIYQDASKRYHAEVVTYLPDSNYTNQLHQPFSGIALVEDWSGKPLNKFKYATNGSIRKYNPMMAARQTPASSARFIQICYEMSGYNYSVDDPENGYYWTEFCGCDMYFLDEETTSTIEIGGGDYGWFGGVGGGGGSPGVSVAKSVTVLPGSSTISNFKDYSKCFDNKTGSGYTYQVSVCVAQPEPGSRDAWAFSDADGSSKGGNTFSVGHTFLTLSETSPAKTIVRNVGFYPSGRVTPYSPSSAGSLNNDELHDYNVSLSINLTSAQFTSLLNYIAQTGSAGATYNLNSNNCTTFALNALGSIGVELPRTTGTWLNGGGNDPGDLGEDIRQMKLASNMTRSTSEADHTNKGTCN